MSNIVNNPRNAGADLSKANSIKKEMIKPVNVNPSAQAQWEHIGRGKHKICSMIEYMTLLRSGVQMEICRYFAKSVDFG